MLHFVLNKCKYKTHYKTPVMLCCCPIKSGRHSSCSNFFTHRLTCTRIHISVGLYTAKRRLFDLFCLLSQFLQFVFLPQNCNTDSSPPLITAGLVHYLYHCASCFFYLRKYAFFTKDMITFTNCVSCITPFMTCERVTNVVNPERLLHLPLNDCRPCKQCCW